MAQIRFVPFLRSALRWASDDERRRQACLSRVFDHGTDAVEDHSGNVRTIEL
jgi:hypothetical protein